jgi:signal transduction histidine kinase
MQAVAAQAAAATSAESVCVNATQALVSNPDIPFAQVYLSDGHGFRLRGSAGLAAPGFGSGSQESGWPLQAVVNGGLPEIIDVPEFDGDLPRLAVAAPIIDAGHRLSTGVLVAGIADVRPIDDRQLGFLDLVAGQIGAALTARRALALASATAERELIERNLHDSVQQQWIAARMLIGLVRDSVKTNPDKAIGLLDDVVRELETALEQMREIVQGIPPSLLKTEGLVAAVEEVCRRAPIDAYLHAEGIGRLPDAVETAVYYVCLEALQNVAKHGGPGASADVHFLQDGGAFRIRITDTGAGFDEDDRPSGRGLQNMHARIEALGGSLEVRSSRDRGTTLSASVPLP